MQSDLNEKSRRELEQLKEKYERMLQEMRMNASSDKEFVQMELQRRITELEQQIVELKAKYADDQEKLMAD